MADAAKWDANFLWFSSTRSISRRSHSDWFSKNPHVYSRSMKMPVKGVHEDTRHGISVGVSARIMNINMTYTKNTYVRKLVINLVFVCFCGKFGVTSWPSLPCPDFVSLFPWLWRISVVSASNKGGWVFQHHTKSVVLVGRPLQHVWATLPVFPVGNYGECCWPGGADDPLIRGMRWSEFGTGKMS